MQTAQAIPSHGQRSGTHRFWYVKIVNPCKTIHTMHVQLCSGRMENPLIKCENSYWENHIWECILFDWVFFSGWCLPTQWNFIRTRNCSAKSWFVICCHRQVMGKDYFENCYYYSILSSLDNSALLALAAAQIPPELAPIPGQCCGNVSTNHQTKWPCRNVSEYQSTKG